jgi:hypothetical protein
MSTNVTTTTPAIALNEIVDKIEAQRELLYQIGGGILWAVIRAAGADSEIPDNVARALEPAQRLIDDINEALESVQDDIRRVVEEVRQ